MRPAKLEWIAFVDDVFGRALLLRSEAGRHWKSASADATIATKSVTVWSDSDGGPVLAEARLAAESSAQGAAEDLERAVAEVLGPVSLGSPTLWVSCSGSGVVRSDERMASASEQRRRRSSSLSWA
jgi:hypothetical protein